MEAAIVAFAVALGMLLRAMVLKARESRRRGRLRAVEARIIDPGQVATTSTTDRNLFAAQVAGYDQRGDAPMPPEPAPRYHARWEYEVDGHVFQAASETAAPVFSAAQARAGRAVVHYDPANPAVSEAVAGEKDRARAWFRGAALAAGLGVLAAGFGYLEALQAAP